jgi:hypothetical protein
LRFNRIVLLCFAGSITSCEMLADFSEFSGYALVRYADVPVKDTECFEDLVWEHIDSRMSQFFGFATEAVDGAVERARVYFALHAHARLGHEQWRDALKLGLDDGYIVNIEFYPTPSQAGAEPEWWEAAIVAEAVASNQVAELIGEPPHVPPEWTFRERRPVETEWYVYGTECILRGSLIFAGALCIQWT